MTFNDGRWNAHKPTGEVFTQNVIYLKHCNGNHYEVVTCVKHRDRDDVVQEHVEMQCQMWSASHVCVKER